MGSECWESLVPRLLSAAGLDPRAAFEVSPLTGGVSSDIVRIRLADGRDLCAKRALPQLKVAAHWAAPLERNHYEAAWLRLTGEIVPGAAPRVLAEERAQGAVLLEYLAADAHLLWKDELLAGRVDPRTAIAVASVLGRIHAATLGDAAVAAAFPTDHLIEALRLDPYLRHTASRHPDCAVAILEVLRATMASKLALVHGDVSPKNILISKRDHHPILLDAECAWYGDPAFDAAFCLNHLLLKSVHMPVLKDDLLNQAIAFAAEWLSHFPPALRPALDGRAAALLPCLMLARIDGKSPVEYLNEASRQTVRTLSIPMIWRPLISIQAVIAGVA